MEYLFQFFAGPILVFGIFLCVGSFILCIFSLGKKIMLGFATKIVLRLMKEYLENLDNKLKQIEHLDAKLNSVIEYLNLELKNLNLLIPHYVVKKKNEKTWRPDH